MIVDNKTADLLPKSRKRTRKETFLTERQKEKTVLIVNNKTADLLPKVQQELGKKHFITKRQKGRGPRRNP